MSRNVLRAPAAFTYRAIILLCHTARFAWAVDHRSPQAKLKPFLFKGGSSSPPARREAVYTQPLSPCQRVYCTHVHFSLQEVSWASKPFHDGVWCTKAACGGGPEEDVKAAQSCPTMTQPRKRLASTIQTILYTKKMFYKDVAGVPYMPCRFILHPKPYHGTFF